MAILSRLYGKTGPSSRKCISLALGGGAVLDCRSCSAADGKTHQEAILRQRPLRQVSDSCLWYIDGTLM